MHHLFQRRGLVQVRLRVLDDALHERDVVRLGAAQLHVVKFIRSLDQKRFHAGEDVGDVGEALVEVFRGDDVQLDDGRVRVARKVVRAVQAEEHLFAEGVGAIEVRIGLLAVAKMRLLDDARLDDEHGVARVADADDELVGDGDGEGDDGGEAGEGPKRQHLEERVVGYVVVHQVVANVLPQARVQRLQNGLLVEGRALLQVRLQVPAHAAVQVLWEVVVVEPAGDEVHLLAEAPRLQVRRPNDGRDLGDDESIERAADDHGDHGRGALQVRLRQQVAVAYRRHRREGPI
mmetsp:Transcript_19427/g.65645  ORF Transcript_19427/g.65645 Transcript_19427/m.65645 type:complete len:290 (-) Transcript_19427:1465-2334(-)